MAVKKITVLLADDHQIVREGFRSLLGHESDIEVVGEAETGRQAVKLTGKLHPAVVVMDIAMPLLNGLEATRQIRRDFPTTKVLILSAHNDDAYVEQASALGASGFLLKQTSAHVLAKAIRDVGEGRPFLKGPPSGLSLVVPRTARARAGNAAKKQRLTVREAEVLQLIAEGKGNKQIALELGVSFKTVDKHRQHLMIKLNVHDVAGLTRYAIHEGMIESGGQVTIK